MRAVVVSPRLVPAADYGFTPDLLLWPVEVAPDSGLLPRGVRTLTATDLLDDQSELQRHSWSLAHELWPGTPEFQGIRLLEALEDGTAVLLQEALLQERLHEALREKYGEVLIHAPHAHRWNLLEARLRVSGRTVTAHLTGGAIGWDRFRRRMLAMAGEARRGWKKAAGTLVERLDERYRFQPLLGPHVLPKSPGSFVAKPALAYSAALVFTGTILEYLPRLEQACFVVNGSAAARPLLHAGHPFRYIWEFHRKNHGGEKGIGEHLVALEKHVRERTAYSLLRECGLWDAFMERYLPQAARVALLTQEIFDRLRPEFLVVANQGSSHEAIMLLEAGRRGIPSLMLQHGVFGADFMEYQPLRAERLWVRGPFWKDVLPPGTAARAEIVPPGVMPRVSSAPQDGDAIVFLSAPVSNSPYRHLDETRELLLTSYRAARELGRPLLVRVHPRESRELYAWWLEREGGGGYAIDQGSPLEDVLKRARMVVTFSSTIFMTCMARGIPLISFDWHPFRFKDAMRREGAFMFASTLSHLRELMRTVDEDPGRYAAALREKARCFQVLESP